MVFRLTAAHELIGEAYVLARQGENNIDVLATTIEVEELLDKNCYIEFEKDDHSKFTTPRLNIVDGVVTYALGNGLFDGTTHLKVQYVFRDGNNYCWKSFIKKFIIFDSIGADDDYPTEYPNFITDAQRVLSECENAAEEISAVKEDLIGRMNACEETVNGYEHAEDNRIEEFNGLMNSLEDIRAIADILTALENEVYAPIENEGSFVSRTTANNENIINGTYAKIKVLGGRTIKVDGNIANASVNRVISRGGTREDVLEIPNEIKQLDCYGAGLSDTDKNSINYIDFENSQYVQNVKKVNAWEMNWTYNSNLKYFTSYGVNSEIVTPATNSTKGSIIAKGLETDTYTHIYNDAENYDNCVSIVATPQASNGSICVSKQEFTNAQSFVQFLQQNNVVFYYKIKTPIITSVNLPKKKIQAFKGGQEVLENENNVPAYLEATYKASKN